MPLDDQPTILLVEASPELRSRYRQWLTQEDEGGDRGTYQVLEASSIIEALAVCGHRQPQVVCLSYDRSTAAAADQWLIQVQRSADPVAVIACLQPGADGLVEQVCRQGFQDFWWQGQVSAPEVRWRVRRAVEWVQLQYQAHDRETLASLQRQTAAELRETEACFRQIAESIQDVFFIYPAADNRPIYMSPAYERLWGHSPDRLQEHPELWLEAIHPDDRAQVQQIFQQGGAAPLGYEYRMVAADGAIHWMRVRLFPVYDDRGQIYRIAGIAEDITDRKQVEAELTRKNQELECTNQALARATRLKDEFLANMSHELRTPLNAILGLAEGLLDHVYGELPDRQRSPILTIKRSGGHLLALINDLLDIAKIEAGQLDLAILPVTVQHLCEFSLSFVQPQALRKGIQLEWHSPPHLGQIQVDARRMRQVLVNLLSNAVKFTPPGGRVMLKVQIEPGEGVGDRSDDRPSQQGDGASQDWITFSVGDTGIGIAPDNLHRLFQTFVQGDGELNRPYGGTGLGLALVRRITEMHGGWVSVESRLGQGSCFTVRLPYGKSGQAPDRAIPVPPVVTPPRWIPVVPEGLSSPDTGLSSRSNPAREPVEILLVEDNVVNRESTADYLLHRGYQVRLAANGEEALALVQQQSPDVILMDVQMPGMDGITATQILRQQDALQDVIIIALTARITSTAREHCLAAGMDEYLVKPVPMQRVIHTIEQLLGQRRRDRHESHPYPSDRGR